MCRILLWLFFAAGVHATSVSPVLHECPVCGVKSVAMSLDSYSQFGEPARDLSDSPRFRFASVDICPGDLYASWSGRWEKIDATERAKLAAFLKEPELHLTKAERSIVGGHEDAFRKSPWFTPLWARSCDGLRASDERTKFFDVLRLHFHGGRDAGEDWEKELGALFREKAIEALNSAVSADWTEPQEKRVFTYLRGELIRQAGRDEEALEIFRKVIAGEKSAEPDEELEWISRWATEQSLRCVPERKDANKERVGNVLRRAVGSEKREETAFRNNVLMPAVRKAAVDGGIPVVEIPKSNPFSWLPPVNDQDTDEKAVKKTSLNDLSRELYFLWAELPASARADIARVYIRVLREDADELEEMKYPVSYFLPEIAESEEGRAWIAGEMVGGWKSSFGEAVCAYAARSPDSSEAFLEHPLTSKTDPDLLVKLLIQRSDAGWTEEAIRKLNEDKWVSSSIVKYLYGLDLPEARKALGDFVNKVRSGKAQGRRAGLNGNLSTLQDIENLQVEDRLREIPLK